MRFEEMKKLDSAMELKESNELMHLALRHSMAIGSDITHNLIILLLTRDHPHAPNVLRLLENGHDEEELEASLLRITLSQLGSRLYAEARDVMRRLDQCLPKHGPIGKFNCRVIKGQFVVTIFNGEFNHKDEPIYFPTKVYFPVDLGVTTDA